jgi:multiple sugar transport system substrate-binding protein
MEKNQTPESTTSAPTQTRREVLKKIGLMTAALATPVGVPLFNIVKAQTSDRFAKYRGTTIVFHIPAHPHYDAALRVFKQFTNDTGIKVEVDRMDYARAKDKQLLEMSKPQGDYDLIAYVVNWKSEYVKKNLIVPLEPFFENPQLADPNYDINDLIPGYLANTGLVGGKKGYLPGPGAKLYGLPFGAETSILAYRKDIFRDLRIKPPTNYTELEALLPLINEKGKIGAMTSRGASGGQATHGFLLHLNPLGGEVFDDNWNCTFQKEAGVKALSLMRKIVETGPAGIPSFGLGESSTAFLQGQAAMYMDTIAIFGQVRNTKISRVDGKVGYALHPLGTKYKSQSGGFGIGIPRNSKNKEAAFLFMQWLTSKEQDKAVALNGGNAMRTSTVNDRAVRGLYPEYAILREQIKHADPDWRPLIPEWDQINVQLLGVAVNEALTGAKTPQAALNGAVAPITALMRSAGYIK